MSGFIALPPAPNSDAADKIENDGWFPDLSLAEARDANRIDTTVTPTRLREAMMAAMLEVNDSLAEFKAKHAATGCTGLDAVGTITIGGEFRLVVLYRRAVYGLAKADLIERYRDYDSTDSGMRRATDMEPTIDEMRRNARFAVRDILGVQRMTVDLI